MLLRPNLDCVIHPLAGVDEYGQEQLGRPIKARCAIVTLVTEIEKTTVRADSSASRGSAEEAVSMSRLLFPPHPEVKKGDKVEVSGAALRVISRFPRYNIGGTFDHWQVDLTIWGNG